VCRFSKKGQGTWVLTGTDVLSTWVPTLLFLLTLPQGWAKAACRQGENITIITITIIILKLKKSK